MVTCVTHASYLEQAYYVATIVGVLGLFWYVIETYRLRKISHRQADIAAAQLENSSKPCVLILEDADQLRPFEDRNLILKNVGTGPALNITWQLNKWSDWSTAPALTPGGFIRPPLKPKEVDASGGAECKFASLSGRTYRSASKYTRVSPANTILLEHSFEEIKN